MRSIKVLPESVRNSLRSGIILSDLTRVVEELVFNSLDAGSTKVIVAVGVGTNYIKVTDNGCGITRDGLVLLGERYATSKFEQLASLNTVPTTFGFRGEALSSISDLSLLQVVTKPHGMPNGYSKVIKCSKCLYLGIDDDRQDVGTTVVVRDLFYNQPVRRRHLQSSPKKVLHSVKECILRIALVHLATSFKLIDIESGDELLSLYPSSSPLPLLVTSFGTEVSTSLHKLEASDDKLNLSGFISKPSETFSVKAFQYFYINSRYISKGPIHKLLNQLATDSDLLKADISIRSECGKRNRCQACITYILNLNCPRAYYDLSFEPTKTCAEFKDWDTVFTFIKKSVSCFWSKDDHMSKVDDIWNGGDTLSTRDDSMNGCGLPKKRHKKSSCNISQRKRVHFSDAKWNPDCSTNNKLVVKKQSPIPFHFDEEEENIDDDLMKPFLRNCSSHMNLSPVITTTKLDHQIKFQDDWLHFDDRVDNGESDILIQDSESWLDDNATVWSPPRILDKDSSFSSKVSFDSLLTDGDSFTENLSLWSSPIVSNQRSKSSHNQSLKLDTFDEKTHDDDVDFKARRDKWFDLFTNEEKDEKGIFDFDNMRCSSTQEGHFRNSQNDNWCDFLNDKHETCVNGGKSKITESRFDDKHSRRIRSHSAPPSYKGKKKFIALNSLTTDNSRKSHNETPHNAFVKEVGNTKHVKKSSGVDNLLLDEGATNDLQSKHRHNKKKTIDKGDVLNYEREVACCLDVYDTDSDFTSKDKEGALDFGGKWRNGCGWNSGIEEKTDDVIYQDNILDISSGILNLSCDSLLPKSVSKKCLDDSRVLQQVDKKFIPIVGDGILAIIDQHAADERIRLEDLRNKVLSGKMKTICHLDAEQELVLPEIGYQLLNNYSEQIKKWGWICNFHSQSSVSFKKNLNFLHNQPSVATLIAVPCILGVNLTDVDLLEYLKQLSDTDGSSSIPPAVLRVLNTKACRGAIMFGDALLPSECSLIVEELKHTSLCFQCAHGRPTTVPLVDLVALHKQIAKLGNWNRGSRGPWHGLTRHRPSLERASQRLGQC